MKNIFEERVLYKDEKNCTINIFNFSRILCVQMYYHSIMWLLNYKYRYTYHIYVPQIFYKKLRDLYKLLTHYIYFCVVLRNVESTQANMLFVVI